MKDAHKMYVELNMDGKKPFKFMHVWSKIQDCPKWKSWRLSAAGKGEEGADFDETKMSGRSAERPTGNKKAKHAASASGAQEAMALYVQEVAASAAKKLKMHDDIKEGGILMTNSLFTEKLI